MASFKKKKIAIVGLGHSGLALVKFLKSQGVKNIVGCDQETKPESLGEFQKLKIDFQLGKKYLKNLADFDLIFVSPGVPKDLPEIKKTKKQGQEISSEIKLFFELCPAKIIGITGTNGKSTVTALLGEIFKESKFKVFVGGNIGTPLIDRLDKIGKNDLVILELSSFQLEDLNKSPQVALLLNISPDHLDRYQSFEDYYQTKKNIIRFQGKDDFAILNFDDPLVLRLTPEVKSNIFPYSLREKFKEGAYLEDNQIKVSFKGNEQIICSKEEIPLLGSHNISNILASVSVATILLYRPPKADEITPASPKLQRGEPASPQRGEPASPNRGEQEHEVRMGKIPPQLIRKAIIGFKGLEHRIEFVKEIKGVKYYNDSKSTTPESSLAALNSFPKGKIILIAGGYDKGADFSELGKTISQRAKSLILIGKTADKIAGKVAEATKMTKVNSLKEAVLAAKNETKKGDIVLLSPACASFDMFKNYEERGNLFKKIVKKLN